jgi:type I restriction enzyme, S subunit
VSELPSAWTWATLDDLAAPEVRAITDGPFGSNLKTAHYTLAGPRVIRLQNIGFGEFIDEEAHISEEHFDGLRAHEAKAGDLVVASLGQDLPRSCIVPEHVTPAIVKADCIRVRLHPEINVRYANYALQRPDLRKKVATEIRGVGRPRLGLKAIRDFPIPVAPRAEQERIVAAIEEHLSRVDAGTAAIERVRQRLKLLHQAGVDSAFCERRDAPERSGEELFSYVTSGSRGWARYYSPTGASFIRVGNIARDTIRLDLSDVQLVDAPDGAEGRRTKVHAGDLLITITADIGRVAIAPDDLGEAYINQHVALARPCPDINSNYVAWFISSARGQAQLRALERGATKSGLGLDDIRALRVPLPARSIQDAVAADLELFADRLESSARALAPQLHRAIRLRQTILTAGLSGRLVPQDPDDEPASMMLQRIRAQRADSRTRRRGAL